ncbi:MAG: ABC transporter ATP-binding protein [Clostridia bacterium]|nr:ABC transporter ATP-binding protein [Clostridia bacterium]
MENVLVVEGLKKEFKLSKKQQQIEKTKQKTKIAVNGLSFTAKKGEIYGLLGPNGAGKTTTLRIISTLIKADEGDAYVCGASVKENPEKVREKIGFLTSELKLEDYFTPNYLFDYFSSLHGVSEEVAEKRKAELFKKFGIEDFKEVKVADLSSGMKQKVSLVISLVHDPDFLVFDEPTNGLDVITAKTVTDFLIDLKNQGKSIIISTHIFSLVEKICDSVGIIINGKMVLSDSLEKVKSGRSLEDVFFDLYKQEVGEDA